MVTKTTSRKPSAALAKRAASKAKAAEAAEQAFAKLADTVATLVTSEGWTRMLTAMSSKNGTELGRFSFGNLLLIWAQCPEATALATFDAWKKRGRQVVKGAKSIKVQAPITYTRKDADGKPLINPLTGQEETGVTFRLISEFDVSQTEPVWQRWDSPTFTITPAVSKPKMAQLLQGEAPEGMHTDLNAMIAAQGYTLEYVASCGGANGRTNPSTKTVQILDSLPEAQKAKTTAHELAHIVLDHVADMVEYKQHKNRMECEAESLAYLISAYYGLDSMVYSAPYLGSWAGNDVKALEKTITAVGDTVLKAFRTLLADLEAPEAERLESAPEMAA